MLNAIIRLALRYRMMVIFLSLAALVYGSYVTAHLPIDVLPDLDRPRVVILTEAPNLAPEDIETLISYPIESAVLGATGVQRVHSQSTVGQSVVTIEFEWNVPIFTARQVIQERLTSLEGTFPPNIRPQPGPISSLMGQIMMVGIARQNGPGGGELAPVGKTRLMAELTQDDKLGRLTLAVWNPRDDQRTRLPDPADWTLVKLDNDRLTLSMTRPRQRADALPAEDSDASSITLVPDDKLPGRFHAVDSRLQSAGFTFNKRERRLKVTIGKKTHDVVFPTAQQQELDLHTTADWVIRPRLRKIPGMAQVMLMGGGRKQYQVLVDPMALTRFDTTLLQVEEALKKNNINASGGNANQGEKLKPIRVFGRLGPERQLVLRDIEKIVVKTAPTRNVLVKDVARVTEGAQIKVGECSVNGDPAVVLHIMKQPHYDTRALTSEVVSALREIEESLPADIVVNPDIFQMKGFIDRAVYNVGEALLIGALLVLIVLFLFLLNFRTTFISLTAIPLSLVVTGIVFKLMGWITGTELSINVMTLGGIAVALGELVDDAIVDVENIFRRLRENNLLPQPHPAMRVIYEASVEVRGAIVFGTIMVILVFLPLFALTGMEGRLFAPLAMAYIVSILASLLISLTVTPVLSYYLLPQARAVHRHEDSPLLRLLKWGATYLIRFSMAWPMALLVTTWVLVIACGYLLTQIGANFLPQFDEGSVQINLVLPAGASLQASNEICAIADAKFRAERKSAANPRGKLLQFVRRTGRPENHEDADPVNNTEYIVLINPELGRKREDVLKEMLDELKAELPGVDIEDEQPLQHLIGHMLTGVKAQIAIKVFGDDLDVLRKSAEKIQRQIKDVPGIAPPVLESQALIDEKHIKLRPDKLAYHGVDRYYVADFISTALKGEEVTQVIDGQRRFDVIVRLEDRYRTDFANLRNLRLELPDKRGTVALKELAAFHEGIGANQITRENARRRSVIKVNTQGRDLASVVGDIQEVVRRDVALPPGYSIEYGGQFENQTAATRLISILAGVSVVGMFVVLYMLFPSTRIVLQILNALPTAFIGGVLALLLTRQTLTVASMVGFISLAGIAARNGILLVTHYFHLMKHEGESFSEHMILRGSLERLSPVLMTALTAGIGLIPLVLGGLEPGREILYPVATVILGGLITSTFCEFLIHPGIFWRFSGRDADRLVKRMDHEDELAADGSVVKQG
ncbi:MAG: efflux RND transporter permease subunit [Planctomycetes bacterium]|nr:efflux RND transporter permease subunit [Planctomycetota bacterium]